MNKVYKRTLIIASLLVASCSGAYLHFTQQLIPKSTYQNKLDILLQDDFADGDLILRRGKSPESLAVLLSRKSEQYSHIGIICMLEDQPMVIHASPESKNKNPDILLCERLQDFLAYDRASQFAHYKLDTLHKDKGWLAAQFSVDAFRRKVAFDHNYDLSDDSAFYCTELVYKAYQHSDLSIFNKAPDTLRIPGFRIAIIMPSDLVDDSPYFLESQKNLW